MMGRTSTINIELQNDRIELNMVNQSIFLIEAGIFLAVEYEKMFKRHRYEMHRELKKHFSAILKACHDLEFHSREMCRFYEEVFGEKGVGEKYNNIQLNANFYGMLACLIGDRVEREDEERVLNYIRRYYKSKGFMTNEKLQSLKLK